MTTAALPPLPLPGPADTKDAKASKIHVVRLERPVPQLFPAEDEPQERAEGSRQTWSQDIFKIEETLAFGTNQGVTDGQKYPLFDRSKVKLLMKKNAHHSTCINAKVWSTVGLGHLTAEEKKAREKIAAGDPSGAIMLQQAMGTVSKVDGELTPLCEHTWAQTIADVCFDLYQTHTGYLEIVRKSNKKNAPITGIHWIPSEECHVVIEGNRIDRHYVVYGSDGGPTKRFARFGDLPDFLARQDDAIPVEDTVTSEDQTEGEQENERNTTSEVIEFRIPNGIDRYYGYPDFLAVLAAMELTACIKQFKYDFFINRGCPEFMLFVIGSKLGDAENKTLTDAINAGIGRGNSHKSVYVNLEGDPANIQVQLEKLAIESKGEDSFDKTNESLAVEIVTAHRVPPLLAGILIPGKLGATNELPNALVAFQTLVVGPIQNMIHQILSATLGNNELNGGLGLKDEDFLLRRITEAFDMGAMDTMARMRQTAPEAQAQGRDLKAGVKKDEGADLWLAKATLALATERNQTSLIEACKEYIEGYHKVTA